MSHNTCLRASLLAAALLAAGCVADNHPLSPSGNVDFLFDRNPIYAADVLDEHGVPVLPRQSPYEKVVQLYMTNAGAADQGAYVDVQLDPPGVLTLLPIDASCEQLPGTFRCTAAEDGFAQVLVRSESDWSGEAELTLVGRQERSLLRVNPAGLPEEASNFAMVIQGVDAGRIPARYNALSCTLSPEPDETFSKWPEGATRVREAEVRATPPPSSPTVIHHAPVYVEAIHPEVFVTLDPTCPPPRNTKIRVQLDENGESPRFFFCFSDIGGDNAQLVFSSGAKTGEPRTLDIEPEPRLLRVVTTNDDVQSILGQIDVVSVSAFDADLKKVPITVDIKSTDPTVLALSSATAVLPNEGEESKLLFATPLSPGVAKIQVSPELHTTPVCESLSITVDGG